MIPPQPQDRIPPSHLPAVHYPPKTVARARRALRCSPFQDVLFAEMAHQGVDLQAIAGTTGVHHGYLRRPLPELIVENDLLWLIQVGLLRREVDGQGITNRFRLTILGHQLLQQWGQNPSSWPPPSWGDRLLNLLARWRHILSF